MTVDQSGPADSYGERSLKRAWNFSEIGRQQTWGSLQCRLWVISGQTVPAQNPTVVCYYSNSGQTQARSDCPLSARNGQTRGHGTSISSATRPPLIIRFSASLTPGH